MFATFKLYVHGHLWYVIDLVFRLDKLVGEKKLKTILFWIEKFLGMVCLQSVWLFYKADIEKSLLI
jgi:hypothetical protein